MPKLTMRVFLSPRRVEEKDPVRWRAGWPTPSGVVLTLTRGDARGGEDCEQIVLEPSDDQGLIHDKRPRPGRYRVDVLQGPEEFTEAFVVHGAADDWNHIDIPEHGPADAEVVLAPDGDRRLFLLHALHESGLPLAGARIEVAGDEFTSRADGAVYAVCRDEEVTVKPLDQPGAPVVPRDGVFEIDRRAVGHGSPPEYAVDVYYRPAPARVSVTPLLNRVPLAGVVFELTRLDQRPDDPEQVVTDALNPTCVFEDIPLGRVAVTVVDTSAVAYGTTRLPVDTEPGRHSANVTVSAGDDIDLSGSFAFELARTDMGSLDGDVTDQGGIPLNGVTVVARQEDRSDQATTDARGQYRFPNLPVGDWKVTLAREPVNVGGRRLFAEPHEGVRATVTGQGRPLAPTLVLGEEPHVVFGFVRDETGAAIPYATVEFRTADGATRLGTTQATDTGYYEWSAPSAGRFLAAVASADGKPVRRFPVEVNSRKQLDLVYFLGGSSGNPPPAPPPQAPDPNLADLSTFPLLTEEIGGGGRAAPSGAGDRASTYGHTVEGALRDVLGWRPGSDATGFQSALANAFELREVQGHTEVTWRPRGYAVQADLGALTGAQASIYQRAKNALEQITPLLDGLVPLDPAADPQDTDAVRRIVRAELGELVEELAMEGGPRIQRVDELFVQLLGSRNPADASSGGRPDPDAVGGQLAEVRDRFGLSAVRIGTLDEERIVTNFRIVVDHVLALAAGWDNDRKLFSGTDTQTALGTILIQLSRSLDVVAQSVEETVFALDSVFVDAAQRRTIRLNFTDGTPTVETTPSILLSDLLDWVVRVSTSEGPRLIQDAGKDGVIAIAPTLFRLARLVRLTEQLAATVGQGGDPNLPDGMRTPRVLRALRELRIQLDAAERLAGAVRRPDALEIVFVDGVVPKGCGTYQVTVVGRGFDPGSRAVLTADGRPQLGQFRSTDGVDLSRAGRAGFTFVALPDAVPPDHITWEITVVNPGGIRSNTVEALTT